MFAADVGEPRDCPESHLRVVIGQVDGQLPEWVLGLVVSAGVLGSDDCREQGQSGHEPSAVGCVS